MEESIQARVLPEAVWRVWEKAHALNGKGPIAPGRRSITRAEGRKGFKYQILDVEPGVCFSILWKSLFVRLIFTHSVAPSPKGSEIRYSVKIQGLFAWPICWFLRAKLQKNLAAVLKELVKQLES